MTPITAFKHKNSAAKHIAFHLPLFFLNFLLGCMPMALHCQNVYNTPGCEGFASVHSLSWGGASGQVLWKAGHLADNFADVANSGHDFSFTYTGDTDDLAWLGSGNTPNIQTYFSGGTANVLSHYVNPAIGQSSSISLTIRVAPAIEARLAFDLYHINKADNKGDKLTIFADLNGSNRIYPSFTDNGNPSWTSTGPGIVDANAASTSGTDDQVGVNFNSNQKIDRIVIQWDDCSSCWSGERGFGLGSIHYCTFGKDHDRDGVLNIDDVDDDNDGIPDNYEICGNSPPPAVPGTTTVGIFIQFDTYPEDISWNLWNSSGTLVESGGNYGSSYAGESVEELFTGPVDDYTFTINDVFQNGICCSYGPGYYEIRIQGERVLGGSGNGAFGSSATEHFNSGDFPISPFYCLSSDPVEDEDADNIPNYKDPDFCPLNSKGVCSSMDADGDGIINSFDRDSDNDGIPDLIEAKGTDSNGDGQVDQLTDSDGDGLVDRYDNNATDGPDGAAPCSNHPDCLFASSTSKLLDWDADGNTDDLLDQDGDGQANFIDVDADNDGLTDVTEAGGMDADGDGQLDGADFGDYGLNTAADPAVGGAALILATQDGTDPDNRPEFTEGPYTASIADSDADDVPDFLDVDADNDGLFDNYEIQATADYIAPGSQDSDEDGLLNAYDNSGAFGGKGLDLNASVPGAQAYDHDADALPDYRDMDSDGDNLPDRQEIWDDLYDGDSKADNVSDWRNVDTDGDGLLDCFDSHPDNAAIFGWAGLPAVDNGSTDGGQTTSTGTPFYRGTSLDALLPDNGGLAAEPDLRDQLIQCGVPQVYYALTESSANTNTDFAYIKHTDKHVDGASTNTIRATSSCEPDASGWNYFFNPLEPENYLFAIRNSAGSPNSVALSDLVDFIEIKKEPNRYARYAIGSADATLVMARDWNVMFKNNPAAGSTFDIKFYFKPSELQALDAIADSLMNAWPNARRHALEWFKKPGGLSNADIGDDGVSEASNISALATEVFNEQTGVAADGAGRSTDGNNASAGNGRNFIEFRGLTSFSGGTAMIRIDHSPLPVELKDFYAQAAGCEVMLVWSSASESDFDYYLLERSIDGRNFQPLSQIEAAGGSFLKTYQYQDRTAAEVNYYRLKMVDFDGSFEYSDIVSVATHCDLSAGHLQLYPNPISFRQHNLNLRLHTRKTLARLVLTNVAGQQMKAATLVVQPGWNILSLDISDLPAGIYFLTNRAENRGITQRLVITDVY